MLKPGGEEGRCGAQIQTREPIKSIRIASIFYETTLIGNGKRKQGAHQNRQSNKMNII